MLITRIGNVWSEVWASAGAVPVRRQKRLFDERREAERVLHWLDTLPLAQLLLLHLFPSLLHLALIRFAHSGTPPLSLKFFHNLECHIV